MGSLAMCSNNGNCAKWALKYMDYCLCNFKDGISLSLGVISVITWTFAEIPQIITNYRQKSAQGLSFAFLATWMIGDVFNVVGCWMEPATLPTQFYTAVLYTLITLVLFVQAIYYDYIYRGPKQQQEQEPNSDQFRVVGKSTQSSDADVEQGYYIEVGNKNDPIVTEGFINIPASVRSPRDLYYVSARSLSKGCTPPIGSFSSQRMASNTADQPRASLEEPFLATQASTEPETTSRVKPMLSVVSALTFLGTVNLTSSFTGSPNAGSVIHVGRKLLQLKGGMFQDFGIVSLLGWGMAAIYVGGRVPQIFLTMRKGDVEGVNPLMFLFAVIGNATYVGSILVNSLNWSDLRPNLPWLVDSAGCVLLDGFVYCFSFTTYAIGRARLRKVATLKDFGLNNLFNFKFFSSTPIRRAQINI